MVLNQRLQIQGLRRYHLLITLTSFTCLPLDFVAKSLHHLIPYDEAIMHHHKSNSWNFQYWFSSCYKVNEDSANNTKILFSYGYFRNGAFVLDEYERIKMRSAMVATDVNICRCFNGLRRACTCRQKVNAFACLLCSFSYLLEGTEPPLRNKLPPQPCLNKYNAYEYCDSIKGSSGLAFNID